MRLSLAGVDLFRNRREPRRLAEDFFVFLVHEVSQALGFLENAALEGHQYVAVDTLSIFYDVLEIQRLLSVAPLC